jgi:hypothetical protein
VGSIAGYRVHRGRLRLCSNHHEGGAFLSGALSASDAADFHNARHRGRHHVTVEIYLTHRDHCAVERGITLDHAWHEDPHMHKPDLPRGIGSRAINDSKAAITRRSVLDVIAETYGADAERFLATPRASLGGRTPREALDDGDVSAVREIALQALLGDWS